MTAYLGDFPAGATLYVPFNTFNAAGASVTLSGLATTDILIYKDGGTTERASQAGYTLLDTDGIDFDGKTGIHGFSIDLSDNTDAGFYAAGHEYWVVVSSVTVDSQTVNFVAGTFSIERANGALALIKSRLPTALVSGRIDASVGAMAANTMNASALATDAVAEIVAAALTTAMTESYAAQGVAPTLAQFCFAVYQQLQEYSTGGSTTGTVKKLDQTTTAFTTTLNNATTPTAVTRAT